MPRLFFARRAYSTHITHRVERKNNVRFTAVAFYGPIGNCTSDDRCSLVPKSTINEYGIKNRYLLLFMYINMSIINTYFN